MTTTNRSKKLEALSEVGAVQGSDALLISLGILHANWGDGQSYVDNFLPFVAQYLKTITGPVSAGGVRTFLQQEFGMDLPHAAVKTVLARACRQGLVTRSAKRFLPVPEVVARFDGFAKQSVRIKREIESLIHRFQAYALHTQNELLTDEQAEDLLLAYIEDWGLPVLRSCLNGAAVPTTDLTKSDRRYVVSSFIVDLWASDPEGAEYLEHLVKGNMLRSALYLPDYGRLQQRFSNTTAFFDTPFLLGALGLKGEEERAAAREVLDLAADLGAHLACFADTVSEMRRVIVWNADAMRPRADRRTAGNRPTTDIIESGLSYSELDHVAGSLEQELRKLGLRIEECPDWDEQDTDLELDLRDALDIAISYRSGNPLDHDVRCLISVHRLRHRKIQLKLESCRAVFITTNAAVVEVSRRVMHAGDPLAAPVAMLDHEFATLLWLKSPTKAPDLPRKQVIADCHAALNPSDTVWTAYLDEIDRLSEKDAIDAEDYFLARNSIETRRALMNRTRGGVTKVTRELAVQVVNDVREQIAEPIRAQARTAIEAAAAEAETKRRAEVDRSQQQLQEVDRSHREEVEWVRKDASRVGHDASVEDISQRLASLAARGTIGVVLVAVGVAITIGVFAVLVPNILSVPNWVQWLGYIAVVAGTVVPLVTGHNLSALKRLEPRLHAKFVGPIRKRVDRRGESELIRTESSAADANQVPLQRDRRLVKTRNERT